MSSVGGIRDTREAARGYSSYLGWYRHVLVDAHTVQGIMANLCIPVPLFGRAKILGEHVNIGVRSQYVPARSFLLPLKGPAWYKARYM